MSMQDALLLAIVLPGAIVAMMATWTIVDRFEDTGLLGEKSGDDYYSDMGKKAVLFFDGAMVFILVSVILGAVILASQIPTHPVMVIPALLFSAVAVYISGPLANMNYRLLKASQWTSASNQMPKIAFLVEHFPKFVFAACLLLIVAMYARPRGAYQMEPM